jgi:hypothetical protein
MLSQLQVEQWIAYLKANSGSTLSMPKLPAGTENVRYVNNKGIQIYNPDDSLWYTITATGVPPMLGLAAVGDA